MKKIKFLLVLVALSAITFYSCNDNESIENEAITQKSFSLRMVLNEYKKANNISGKSTTSESDGLCFEFVFPLNLSFNNGTVVSVPSLEGIINILTNENENMYINGIEFPFQVVATISNNPFPITINNESDFSNLIQGCGMETYQTYVSSGLCFEYTFPLSYINQNGVTIVTQNENDLIESFQNGNALVELAFPVNVVYEGQTVAINSLYELFEMDNDCSSNSNCICPTVYSPVCVQTATGQIQVYPNACEAECEGYTSADFVDCDGGNNIFNYLGTCFNMQYPVQVQVGGAIVTVNNNNQLLEFFGQPSSNATLVFPVTVTTGPAMTEFTFFDQSIMELTLSNICN